MKSYINKIAVCFLALASVFACQRLELEQGDQTGYLYVDIDKDESEDLVFKSLSQADNQTIALKIYDYRDSVVASFADWKELQGKPISLKVGRYKAVATSAGEAADAAFDTPFYKGTSEFSVSLGAVSNVNIKCTLANVKVTASFSSEITDNFQKYELVVSNGSAALTFSNLDGTVSREGYFSATGKLTWTLTLVDKNGRQYKALTETYSDVKPKQHYNLSFSVDKKPQVGGGALSIIVDNSIVEKQYDLTLNFGETNPPVITPDFEYQEDKPLEINAGDMTSRKFTFTSADGLRTLLLEYDGVKVDLVDASAEAISNLQSLGIKTESVPVGAKNAVIDMTQYISNRPMGDCHISILATDVNGVYSTTKVHFVLRSPVASQAMSADAWAMFATLKAKWFAEIKPEGLELHYKKASDNEWIIITESSLTINNDSRSFSAELTGLVPGTEYIFRTTTAVDKAAGKQGPEVRFTTEQAPGLPNMSFDAWTKGSTGWFPNATADESSPEFIWDSANTKVMVVSIEVTTPEESHIAVSGADKRAAKLSSIVKAGNFAAGNIYTGNFGEATLNPKGAKLKWGVPFNGRPLALKGFYDYRPVNISHADGAHNHLMGQPDVAQIQVILTDWTAPFDIDTAKNQFVDTNAEYVIGYGTMDFNSTQDYQSFELKIDYRDMTRKPTYIVIVAAASKYGDFFTGGAGSVLYLDEFEFVYDKTKLSN